ncbi:MAG: ArnT family glycosyltransferase, partial [Planctomycetaceae bacterium]
MSKDERNQRATRRCTAAFALATLCAAAFVGWKEWVRGQSGRADGGAAQWLAGMDVDATPYVFLMALLPFCWFLRGSVVRWPRFLSRFAGNFFGPQTKPGETTTRADLLRSVFLAGVAGVASLSASLHVAYRPVKLGRETKSLRELPPAYQDEYSYLLQARTFLAGRWSFPSHPTQPRLFDQMHVVNQGRYASRYFPATGAWMATFVWIGRPYWGHWLAGALTAMFVFAAGRELGGNGVGLVAGVLTGVAPGMAVFSNLLLAHHPALVGLALFLWMSLRMLRTGRYWCAALAGTGLSFAMLGRPMTAFGFGLPFGVVFVLCALRRLRVGRLANEARLLRETGLLAAMGLPILAGFGVLAWQNHAVTGHWTKTPYQQFNDVYTPRHVFGFNNGERAEARIAAGEARTNDVFRNYDEWATNLTPRRAAENVRNRIVAGGQWTLGIVPLLMAVVVFAGTSHRDERRWWLVAAAILSLHVVHVPYWYDGIMHWHYVFETGPLLLLLFARATQLLLRCWRASNRGWMPVWWGGVVVTALTTAYFPLRPLWDVSRVDAEVAKLAFSKTIYHRFRERLSRRVRDDKALVLVEGTCEIHFEFVVNRPDLVNQPLLIGRLQPGFSREAVVREFPDRAVYVWRSPPNGEIERIA